MAPSRTFPKLLIWALAVPLAAFLIASQLPKPLVVPVFIFACGAELIAVPIATYLLIRGTHVTIFNVLLTLVAAIPIGLVIAMAWTLKFGHFHI
jgi:hypothetical protein